MFVVPDCMLQVWLGSAEAVLETTFALTTHEPEVCTRSDPTPAAQVRLSVTVSGVMAPPQL